jgi:hypothetical protein
METQQHASHTQGGQRETRWVKESKAPNKKDAIAKNSAINFLLSSQNQD